MIIENKTRNIRIQADKILISDTARFGENIDINVSGQLSIGDRTYIGNRILIGGREITLGNDVRIEPMPYRGLDIGAGKQTNPNSILTVGDRCTIHDGHIDLSQKVTLGNDVGISPQTFIYNHGYWMSVLEGFPQRLGPVEIGSGTIVGFRSSIFGPAKIAEYSVLGAETLVLKDLIHARSIYAGAPAKFIKKVEAPSDEFKINKLNEIIEEYTNYAKFNNKNPDITIDYPSVKIDEFKCNVETLDYEGLESIVSDDFRRFIFRYGIRIYTNRPLINRGESWDALQNSKQTITST